MMSFKKVIVCLICVLGVNQLFALDLTVEVGENIQSAINDVSSDGGGTVTLKAGTHIITSSIEIKSNITLQGEGDFLSTVKTVENIKMIVQSGNGLENITITNLTLIGTNAVDGGGIDIVSYGADHDNINLLNLRVYETGWGVHVKGAENVTIENCDFSRNGAVTKEFFAHNLYLRRCTTTVVNNCLLNNSISANGCNISYSVNVSITNCEMIGNYFRGVRAADSDGYLVHNCVVMNNGNVGILANTEHEVTKNIDIQNNCVANNAVGIETKNGATGVCKNNNSYGNGTDYKLVSSVTQSSNISDGNQACGTSIECSKTTASIEAECYDDSLGIQVVDGSVVGYIENGDWASYNGLDLSDMNSVEATYSSGTAGGTLEFRLDALDGEVIGEMELSGTGGWDAWETESININRVEGIHNLYLVFTGGDGYLFDLDKFGFSEDVYCNSLVGHIEAECHYDMFEIQSENCSEGTKNIGWIQDGDWAMYSGVDLTNMQSIKARVSGNTTGSTIEVRIDGEDGELIGEIPVTNTGDNQNWVTDSVNIESTNGVHDVYLKFSGADGYLFNINYFGFSEESIVVTGLDDQNLNYVKVYPNPTNTDLFISGAEKSMVELFTSKGELILTDYMIDVDYKMDMSNYSTGVFFLKITSANGSKTSKIIKQ